MINPAEYRNPVFRSVLVLLSAVLACSMTFGLAGCGEKEEEPQAVAPPPPPPPDPMANLDLAPGVEFPEERDPSTAALAQSIAQLANAIREGDAQAMVPVLGSRDRMILNVLESSGKWEASTKDLEIVRVCVLNEMGEGTSCELGLGLQNPNGAYMLAWTGQPTGDSWIFSGLSIEPLTAERAYMLDDRQLVPRMTRGIAIDLDLPPPPEDSPDDNESGGSSSPSSPGGPLKKPRI